MVKGKKAIISGLGRAFILKHVTRLHFYIYSWQSITNNDINKKINRYSNPLSIHYAVNPTVSHSLRSICTLSVVEIKTRTINLDILFVGIFTSDVIELTDLLFAAAKSYIEGVASRLIPAR